jgi:hypothetical protein
VDFCRQRKNEMLGSAMPYLPIVPTHLSHPITNLIRWQTSPVKTGMELFAPAESPELEP